MLVVVDTLRADGLHAYGCARELSPQLDALAARGTHGEEFLEHDLFGHAHQSFRETVRVPLILAGPGVERGDRIADRVDSSTLGATLLRLADVAPAGYPRERDVFTAGEPVFFGTRRGWAFVDGGWSFVGPTWCVLDGQWFLQWSPDATGGVMARLFDVEADPEAKHDVAADEEAQVARLRGLIETWLQAEKSPALRSGREEEELLRGMGYAGNEKR
ncbi:MAG: hypothetical protein GY711_20350 [bacterium]|nr:hypothetical protein [bacterium]